MYTIHVYSYSKLIFKIEISQYDKNLNKISTIQHLNKTTKYLALNEYKHKFRFSIHVLTSDLRNTYFTLLSGMQK